MPAMVGGLYQPKSGSRLWGGEWSERGVVLTAATALMKVKSSAQGSKRRDVAREQASWTSRGDERRDRINDRRGKWWLGLGARERSSE